MAEVSNFYYDAAEALAMRQCTRKDGSNKCLSRKAVAELMGVHENTIYNWERRGAPKWAGLAYESIMARLGADAVETSRLLAEEAKACAENFNELREIGGRINRFLSGSERD